ncbi:MAG: hypothetical protein GTO02_19565 [Candidatus Dadabacteria bacterium]|nr:hypothetical protein [Candidatus Dadabacteria bacterium]NIQ16506.1 hypothetical protein [Candidatus Dadabacteria bacterium]
MNINTLREFFGICSLINIGILLYWFLMLLMVRDWIYKIHSKWFKIPEDRFDDIHYRALAYFKLSIFLFNVVPYFALVIID